MHKAGEAFGLPAASLEKLEQVRVGAMDALDRAHRAGVNLVYGSDLLADLHVHQLGEFTIRAQVQPIIDILRSATSTAARLLGMEGRIGTLARGAVADLLVLDGDPLADLAVLTSPERYLRFVVRAGDPIPVAG